jgi:hypothetical protein
MSDQHSPKSIDDRKLEFEYLRLAQEKYLKEKELEQQLLLSRRHMWTTPWIAALIAGIIGLVGTLWNSCQNRLIERQKQEGVLILEAIKTGTGETKNAAANLLFLDQAGLIQLRKGQRASLEVEAGTKNPLPSLPGIKENINFEPSSALTSDMRQELQTAIDNYLGYLYTIGYQKTKTPLNLFVNPKLEKNIIYNPFTDQLEVPPSLVADKEAVLQQYTLRILMDFSGDWIKNDSTVVIQALLLGLSDYFTCSYHEDPILGEKFVEIIKSGTPYLRNLDNQLSLSTEFDRVNDFYDIYDFAEAWGGSFWELRNKIGKSLTDKILFLSWKKIVKEKITDQRGKFFFEEIIKTDIEISNGKNKDMITSIFRKRGLVK